MKDLCIVSDTFSLVRCLFQLVNNVLHIFNLIWNVCCWLYFPFSLKRLVFCCSSNERHHWFSFHISFFFFSQLQKFLLLALCRCCRLSLSTQFDSFALHCCSMHSHIHSFTCIFSLVFFVCLFYFSLWTNPHSAHTDIHKCRLLHRLIDPKSHESKLENLKCHRQRRHTKFKTRNNFLFLFVFGLMA